MFQHHITFSKNNVTRLTFSIVLVSFLLSTFVSLWSLSIMSQRNARELSRMMAARIYDSISGELNEPVTLSLAMAKDSFLIKTLQNEKNVSVEESTAAIQEYLEGIREWFNYESVYVISDATRRYYNYDGLSKIVDPEHDEHDYWYGAFLEKMSTTTWMSVSMNRAMTHGRSLSIQLCGIATGTFWACAASVCICKRAITFS